MSRKAHSEGDILISNEFNDGHDIVITSENATEKNIFEIGNVNELEDSMMSKGTATYGTLSPS